ncbi:MAG: hypothetical protein R3E01_08415 [Pirellulaceae bacterium]|nr:hypothetical protein [Planctomycetales bacterium]
MPALPAIWLLIARNGNGGLVGATFFYLCLYPCLRHCCCLCVAAQLLLGSPAIAAERNDLRLVRSLREARLFYLAGELCRDKLNQSDISPEDLNVWTGERIQNEVALARQLPPSEREARWNTISETVAEYEQAHSRDPRLIVVRMQGALAWLTRAELEVERLRVGTTNDIDDVRQKLRETIQQIVELQENAQQLLRESYRAARRTTETMESSELLALQGHLVFYLAHAYRLQAESYPQASADRAHAATLAVAQLQNSVADQAPAVVVWLSRRESIICQRLLENYRAAAAQCAHWLDDEGLPDDLRGPLLAESIRIAIDQQKLDEAATRWETLLQQGDWLKQSADVALVGVECRVAQWQAAIERHDESGVSRYQQLASAAVRQIEQDHDAYWLRRAEGLLIESATSQSQAMAGASTSGDVLVRTAEGLYRRGQVDEAIATLDKAVTALNSGTQDGTASKDAFPLAFQAAAMEHERNHFAEALGRFRTLALQQKTHPRAAEAHRMAVLDAANVLREESSNDNLRQYTSLLEEHLANWPQVESADTVRWWQARLLQNRGQYLAAAESYLGIRPSHPNYVQAVLAASDCQLQEAPSTDADRSINPAVFSPDMARYPTTTLERAGRAARQFESLWQSHRGQAALSKAALAELVSAARIRMRFGLGDYEMVWSELSRQATDVSQNESDGGALARKARLVLIATAAGVQRWQEAHQLLLDTPELTTPELAELLLAWESIGLGHDTEDARRETAQLRLDALEHGAPAVQSADAATQRLFGIIKAWSLADTGRIREAIESFGPWQAALPDDGDIQEAYGTILSKSPIHEVLEEARDHWRTVANRADDGTPRWFRARYALARTHWLLGDRERAREVVAFVQALHPQLGGEPIAGKFRELLTQLELGP